MHMDDVCPAPVKERYWEIDAIRGFALLAMIILHTVFLLGVFHIIDTEVWLGLYVYLPLGTSVFVIISGAALVLRHGRMAGRPRRAYHFAILKRGVEIFLIGVGVSVVASLLILLFINDAVRSLSGRGLATTHIYQRDGRLVASMAQDMLISPRDA